MRRIKLNADVIGGTVCTALIIGALALVLASCARPTADLITDFCTKNGYQPGTQAFLDCFATVAKADNEAKGTKAVNTRTLTDTGLRMMEMGQERPVPTAPRPLTCVQQGAFTNCY